MITARNLLNKITNHSPNLTEGSNDLSGPLIRELTNQIKSSQDKSLVTLAALVAALEVKRGNFDPHIKQLYILALRRERELN